MSDRMTLIIAIGLSLFLWVYVRLAHQEPEVTRVIRAIPIKKIGETMVPSHAYELKNIDGRIDLTVKGSAARVSSLSRDEILVQLNVANIKVADEEKLVSVTPEVDLPPGVRLVNSPRIDIITYPLMQRTLPVRIGFLTLPQPGSTIGEYILDPDEVIVLGKSSDVDKIEYATVMIDPRQPLMTPTEFVPRAVGKSGKIIEPVKLLTSTIRVRMSSLTGLQATRQIAVKPPLLKNMPNDLLVFAEKIQPDKVILSGESTLLERLPAFIETEEIDVSSLKSDATRRVNLIIPQGLSVVDATTIQVSLKVVPR